MTTVTSIPRPFLLLLFAAMLIMLGGTASAQRFERVIDNSTAMENGWFGVRPVSTGGYIAVGNKDVLGACTAVNADVFVVRLNNNGTIAWEMTYDIGNACGIDNATCIIECVNGDFAICGRTQSNPSAVCAGTNTSHSFVMRITAAGALSWLRIYSGINAWRLIEAQNGDNCTTFRGDLVFCGASPAGAFLSRVNGANGAVIWDQSYSLTMGGEFKDLVESLAPAGGSVGDIIATGNLDTFMTIARVSGNNGTVVAAPHAIAIYGVGVPYNKLQAVVELQVGVLAGDIVATGYDGVGDIYMIRTAPNPCTVNLDALHSDAFGANDQPRAIMEINPPATSVLNAGDIVITGESARRANTDNDAFLLQLNPATLAVVLPPGGAGFNVYNGVGTNMDWGMSVHPTYSPGGGPLVMPTDGFIICGTSDQAAAFPPNLDMYIIKTNRIGSSSCDDGQVANTQSTPGLVGTCPPFTLTTGIVTCTWTTTPVGNFGSLQLCFRLPKSNSDDSEIGGSLGIAPLPNPVRTGTVLQVAITTDEATPATITVTDVTGKLVTTKSTTLAVGDNTLDLNTNGWPSGTYMVTVGAGDLKQTMRVIVE